MCLGEHLSKRERVWEECGSGRRRNLLKYRRKGLESLDDDRSEDRERRGSV